MDSGCEFAVIRSWSHTEFRIFYVVFRELAYALNHTGIMGKRLAVLLFLVGLSNVLWSQESDNPYTSEQDYRVALNLYHNRQFQAAQTFLGKIERGQNSYFNAANQSYYFAGAAVRLNQIGADRLMTDFVDDFPLSVRRNAAFLDVADYYFDIGKYPNAVTWYRKADLSGLFGKNRERYYFRLGYGLFTSNKPEEAKRYLQRVSNSREFGSQAKYYLGFSAYQQDDYEQASRQFDQITDQKLLQEKLGYFQADMNFKLGKFQEAIDLGLKQLPKSDAQETSELNKIIGESYFNLKEYEKAIPYLKAYKGKQGKWNNTDFYLLGYAYYRQGEFSEAVSQFNKIIDGNDFVAQNAYYHLGICYLELDKKQEALNAFRGATAMKFDSDIQQNALYNYALLGYETGNPYESVQEVLSEYLNRYPNDTRNSQIRALLVNSYISTRNFEGALALARNNRNNIDDVTFQKILYFRAGEFFVKEDYKAAQAMFREATEIKGDSRILALSTYWMAESDYALRNFQDAILGYFGFRKLPSVAQLPEFRNLDYQLGYAYFNLKRFNEALSAFQAFYRENPDGVKSTDALMRIGDSYFAESQYREALLAYEKAAKSGNPQRDYAVFQMAMCSGFLGKIDDKIRDLKAFVEKYPESVLADDALLELGNAYLDQGSEALSLSTYDELISAYPNTPLMVNVQMRKGLLLYNQGKNPEALAVFKAVAERYPNYPEAIQAVESAKMVSVDMGKVAEFANWASGLDFVEISDSELELASYEAAARLEAAGNSKGAKRSYESYLQQFPNGTNNRTVRFNLAQLYFRDGDTDQSLTFYKQVAANGNDATTEQALTRICEILISRNAYNEAIPFLTELEATANIVQNRLFARANLMKGYFQNKDYTLALTYAESVLAGSSVDQRIQSDAYLIRAKTALIQGDSIKAREAYADLLPVSVGEATAEALYYDAYFKQRSNDPEGSNLSVQRLVREYASYREWGGKGLLLMAVNFNTLQDAFQATYILESIIANFSEYPDLVNEAKAELQRIKTLESERNEDVITEGIE